MTSRLDGGGLRRHGEVSGGPALAPQNYTWAKRTDGELLLALERDPYFAGWPDTLQLDYDNPATQQAMVGELLKIDPGARTALRREGRRLVRLVDVAHFAYQTGWRKAEVLTLAWPDVDRARGLITLRRACCRSRRPWPRSSNGAGRPGQSPGPTAPRRSPSSSSIAPGSASGASGKAWASACKTAGVPGLLFHDLRRSAVRNFDRAGVSLSPPLVITRPEIDRVVAVLDKAIEEMGSQLGTS